MSIKHRLHINLAFLAVLSISLSSAIGQVIRESFVYRAGMNLHGGSGGIYWSSSWIDSDDAFTIWEGSLPEIDGYPPSRGNMVWTCPPVITNFYRSLAERRIRPFSSGRIYVAFLMNYQYYGPGKWAGLSLMAGGQEKAFFGEITGADQKLGLGVGDGTYGYSSGYDMYAGPGNDYLVIGCYDFSTRTLSASAFITPYSPPLSDPLVWDVSAEVAPGLISTIDGIALNVGSLNGIPGTPGNTFFDEIRIGSSWTEVVRGSLPNISVLSARQRSDGTGIIDVTYSMTVPYDGTATVTAMFSSNGGSTWSITPQGGSLSGDYGSGISSGSRALQWNAGAQLAANTFNNNYRARLVATAAGATITNMSGPFTVDIRGLHGGLTVAGKVRHAATGQGLSGVSVNLAGQNTSTAGDGSYSFSNVILANGNTITASRSGYATYSATVPAPAGGIQSVPKDINLPPASGSKPVVTGLSPRYDALFIAGVSLPNDYTASIDWRGQTPHKMHFFWNSLTGPQSREVLTSGTQASTSIDAGREFHGSFSRCDRVITVQAENSAGVMSDPYTVCVSVIPLPVFLTGLVPRNFMERSDPKIEWTVKIPPDVPDKLIAQIPLLSELWPDFSVETSVEYSPLKAEWEWFGGVSLENTYRKRGRPPVHTKIYPKLGAGPITVNFSGGLAANGLATQSRGIVVDQVGLSAELDVKLAVAQILLSDWIPGAQVVRILDGLKPFGVDPNSLQRVILYVAFEANSQLMINITPLGYGSSTTELKLGPEVAYEPDLVVIKGRVYVGGRCVATLEGIPLPAIKKVSGELYGGIELQAFGIFVVNEKFLFAHGTIWQAPGITSRSMALAKAGPWEDWISLPLKKDDRRTIGRAYLAEGTEGFALASPSVRAKSVLSANGTTLSPLDAFRLMKQSPVAKAGMALSSNGGPNPPQLAQAELPIITNAFPFSEPTLAGYGQELMLLWVADNANSNDLQYADIRWSRFDGTEWSAPNSIVTDTRADFAPKVAFDGNGDAVAVWQKVNDLDFTNANISAMAAEMEIVWSRWDRSSGIWSVPSALTTNTYYDGSPLLAGPLTNGDLLVTWTQNEANLLMGTGTVGAAENDVVLCSRWSAADHVWTAPEVVVSNLAYRLSQSFAGISNLAVYAWTTDADGVLTNDTDQEIYAKVWSNGVWGVTKRCTSNDIPDKTVRCAVSPQGAIHLVWQSTSNLVSSINLATNARLVRADSASAGFADYAMTYGPQGNMVLLWQEMTTNGSDAHYSVYDPNSDTWSKDATFFNDAPLERSFSPVWDSSGQLNFAYNKVEIIITNETAELEGGGSVTISNVPQQGRVDVVVAVRRLITDVAILPGGFTVEGANYLPGDALTLSAILRNVGDVAVSNAAVSFYEGNPASGGVLITNLAWSGWLEGAATNAILSTVWVVPEPATNRTLYAVANPDQAFTEFTGNNNTQAVNIGGVDLSVSMVAATAETDGSMRVIAQVQNIGAPGATNTTLALRRQGQSGAPLATVDVPALEPGLMAQVGLDLPVSTQPEGEAFYTLQADDSAIVPDIETNNNTASFAVNLWLDSDGDGIPDWWETRYFGGPTAADASAMASNGVNTLLQAFIAGLDPQDPSAFLLVENMASLGTDPETGGFRLTWGSVSNKFYRICRASDLVNGQGFSPIESHILATPPVNTYQDTSAATNAGPFFYRIEVE